MIDELYDDVLSITTQIGYLTNNPQNSINYLKSSNNVIFNFNNIKTNPPYPISILSYDDFFITPFSVLINNDGFVSNIY